MGLGKRGDTVSLATPAGALRSDARRGLVHFSGGKPRAFNVEDGHFLEMGGQVLYASAELGDLSRELEVSAPDTTQVPASPDPDFGDNGQVDFAGFFLFVDAFGRSSGGG